MREKRIAASIKYDVKDSAPRLTAYGQGFLADKILEIASVAGVPLYKEEALAGQLGKVEIGREIPPEMYGVVAEVLSFIYGLSCKEGDEKHGLRQRNG
jgi:flagellar biosynthesis protein